jgi:hypothetical protein
VVSEARSLTHALGYNKGEKMSKNLYELSVEFKKLMAYAEMFAEGEEPVELMDVIEDAEMERNEKIENCGKLYKSFVTSAKQWKEEEQRIAKERKQFEAQAVKIAEWLGLNMGKEAFKTPSVSISAHLDTSVVYDAKPADIPEEYKREKTVTEVNKPAVTEALKNGEVLSFAHLVEKKRIK